MNIRELKRLLPEFQSKSFLGISCLKIQSYAQIYLSIHNMVFVNSLDDEYGRREIYRRKLETLVDILLRRCRRDGIMEEEQVRILDTVFYVLYNSSVTIDRETEDYCWERASDLIEHYRPRLEDEKAESSEVYLAIRLIFYDLYGVESPIPIPCKRCFGIWSVGWLDSMPRGIGKGFPKKTPCGAYRCSA